jgi:uncharacterized Zn finger protein (UPF0148 family)
MTYRCDVCLINWWPYLTKAGVCPVCGAGTKRVNEPATPDAMNVSKRSEEERQSLDNHEKFDEFYAKRAVNDRRKRDLQDTEEIDSLEIIGRLPSYKKVSDKKER